MGELFELYLARVKRFVQSLNSPADGSIGPAVQYQRWVSTLRDQIVGYESKLDSANSVRIRTAMRKILELKTMYQRAEAATGVPWVMFGLIHWREASCLPERQILNGERYDSVTTLVPKGLGPFDNWVDAAVKAVNRQWPFAYRLLLTDWQLPVMLLALEMWNGDGYAKHGCVSPYIWSGTSLYKGGLYIADGVWDPHAQDTNPGCAAILRALMLNDLWRFNWEPDTPPMPRLCYHPDATRISGAVLSLQRSLNESLQLGYGVDPLVCDGWAGPVTARRFYDFTALKLVGDPAEYGLKGAQS